MLFWAHTGLPDSIGVMLVGLSVVVARGLYLARHLFTLFIHHKAVKFADTGIETRMEIDLLRQVERSRRKGTRQRCITSIQRKKIRIE